MDILSKYKVVRPYIKDGDLILFHGTHPLARLIQYCDKAYYNHVGVVVEKLGSLYIVDANAQGVQADRLSWRIKSYSDGGDFCVISSTKNRADVSSALMRLLRISNDTWIKYDYKNGTKELANRLFGWKLKITKRDEHDICSDYVRDYAIELEMALPQMKMLNEVFPQDYLRYRDHNNTKLTGAVI